MVVMVMRYFLLGHMQRGEVQGHAGRTEQKLETQLQCVERALGSDGVVCGFVFL